MFRFSVAFINNFIVVCLMWLIVLTTLYYVSEAIYSSYQPIKTVNNVAQITVVNNQNNLAIINKSNVENLATRLEGASVERGQRLFAQCALCHTAAANAQNRVGPNLWDIIERPVGLLNNFNYSTVMRQLGQSGAKWNDERLDAFLAAPQRVLPGTIMAYRGMNNAQERADLLLYLHRLTDNR